MPITNLWLLDPGVAFATADPSTDEAILIGNIGLSSGDTTNGWGFNPPPTPVTYDNILGMWDTTGKLRMVFGNVGGDVANTYGWRGENASGVLSWDQNVESDSDGRHLYTATWGSDGYTSGLPDVPTSTYTGGSALTNCSGYYANLSTRMNPGPVSLSSFQGTVYSYGVVYGVFLNQINSYTQSAKAFYAASVSGAVSAYGMQLSGVAAGTGNAYGVHIYGVSSTSGTAYGVYQEDSGILNYFAGKLEKLRLEAGTASAGTAPLKFYAGTNMTTPEEGAMEFDATRLYYTDAGPQRQTIVPMTYCTIYEDNNSGTDITLTTAGTYYGWVSASSLIASAYASLTGNGTADRITIAAGGGGYHLVTCQVSFSVSSDSVITGRLYKNGTGQFIKFSRKANATDVGSASFSGIIFLSASDYLDLRFTSDTNSITLNVKRCQLSVVRVGR